jgi:glutathione synthase
MRILFISDIADYVGKDSDVPESYARVAAEADVETWHASPQAVLSAGSRVAASRVRRGLKAAEIGELAHAGTTEIPIDTIDLVFDRVLKPLPRGYLAALVRWRDRVEFVNDPVGILAQLDPRFLLRAAGEFMPPAIVTGHAGEAEAFFDEHEAIVAKKPNSCGGRAVFRVVRVGASVEVSGLARATRRYPTFVSALSSIGLLEPLTLVRYLPRVREGDLRVITLDGVPLGAYIRRGTGWIQNVGAGGHCTPTAVTPELETMIAGTHHAYQAVGVRVLGYDLLVDDDGRRVISEINGGNVGGIFRLETLTGRPTGRIFVDWLKGLVGTDRGVMRAS